MSDDLLGELNKVNSRNSFSKFIMSMACDLDRNKNNWENETLSSFLEAMSAWVDDMDGFYERIDDVNLDEKGWKFFAEILFAARCYE